MEKKYIQIKKDQKHSISISILLLFLFMAPLVRVYTQIGGDCVDKVMTEE